MPKRRKVGNLLALTLLAQLLERPMYPYEMASVLRERGKDQAVKINWGSLYTVVQNLEKNGFIQAVQVDREGRQPERTTYQITASGQAELKDWLRELLGDPEREYTRFEAGLSDAGQLAPDEVVGLLRHRLEVLDAEIERSRTDLAAAMKQIPRLFLIETEYQLAMRQAEADWVRGVLAELAAGTFPGVATWQAIHAAGGFDGTGNVPPEVAQLLAEAAGGQEDGT
ncbi:MAG TPA: PadR family transcriptional regulator [Streptosporangiaceae bacterium]|nr:PadR family transcriptional regulator [Streptosporangiaceae bacterium]